LQINPQIVPELDPAFVPSALYAEGAARSFDFSFCGDKVYGQTLEIIACAADLIAATSLHVGEVVRNPYHLLMPAWQQDS
jgi:hypothetical protein